MENGDAEVAVGKNIQSSNASDRPSVSTDKQTTGTLDFSLNEYYFI